MFDENGKYIRKICRKGRGPKEYIGISNGPTLDFDKNTGNLLVLSSNSLLYEYTPDGDFVQKIDPSTTGYRFSSYEYILKLKDNCYISTFTKHSDTSSVCAYVFDSLYRVRAAIPFPEISQEELKASFPASGWSVVKQAKLFRFDDKIRIVSSPCEIIQSIDSDLNIDTAFIINYGQYKETPENKNTLTPFSKVISFIGYPKESKDYVYLWLNLRAFAKEPIEKKVSGGSGKEEVIKLTQSYGFFNKKTGEVSLMNQPIKGIMGFNDDFEKGPPFWPKVVTSQEYLIANYSATHFLDFANNNKCSSTLKELATRVKEDHNPIIAIVKLK
jgi:hypothetical protein